MGGRTDERSKDDDPSERVGPSLARFSVRVLVTTVFAAALAALALWLWWRLAPSTPGAPAPAPLAGERAGARGGERERPLPDTTAPTTAVARDVERRHAAGELSDAQKRFDRCPGGDVRRLAWIDPRVGVVKLVREREDGAVLEEWFDGEGRLREALVHGRTVAGRWGRRITLDERGRERVEEEAGGAVPDAPPPPLDRADPSAAFFAGPGCAR